MVGVTKYCNYPPIVKDLVGKGEIKVIGGYANPSIEKIVNLEPDLVLATDLQERFVTKLVSLGLTVITLKAERVTDVYNSILLIGRATGKYYEAIELVNELKKRIRSVWSVIRESEKVKVLPIVWLEPLYVAGKKHLLKRFDRTSWWSNVFGDKEE